MGIQKVLYLIVFLIISHSITSIANEYKLIESNSVTLNLTTDDWGEDTSWELKDKNDTILHSGSEYANNSQTTKSFELPEGNYVFTIYDAFGDGLTSGDGSYKLTDGNGNLISTGKDFGSSESTNLSIAGPSTNSGTDGYISDVTLDIKTDDYGSETSWELKDQNGATVHSGYGYASNYIDTRKLTLPDGEYVFTINDSFGDGLTAAESFYKLTDGSATRAVIASGKDFGFSQSTNFRIAESKPTQYTLTVIDGDGDGKFSETVDVRIRSYGENTSSQKFDRWVVVNGNLSIKEPFITATTVKMKSDGTVKATYKDNDETHLPTGELIECSPSPCPQCCSGCNYSHTTYCRDTGLYQPHYHTKVVAQCYDPCTGLMMDCNLVPSNCEGIGAPKNHKLTVINGSGNGTFDYDTVQWITANPAKDGERFYKWELKGGNISDMYRSKTTVLVEGDVTATATYIKN